MQLNNSFSQSSPKRNLIIVSILFSIGILYRAIFNILKISNKDERHDLLKPNKIDYLET